MAFLVTWDQKRLLLSLLVSTSIVSYYLSPIEFSFCFNKYKFSGLNLIVHHFLWVQRPRVCFGRKRQIKGFFHALISLGRASVSR